MTGALAYRPLPTPLHAARASAAACWAASLAVAAILLYHPLALLALAGVVLIAAALARLRSPLMRALRVALLLAVPTALVNVLVSRQGLTVFARIGDLGPFGQGDLTVEALVYGAVIALKVSVVILVCALASLAIDPDQLLAACRRLSFRSALTVSLALRALPLLAADAQRLAEAQRTRPGGQNTGLRARALLVSASVGGALDRALDLAATLELRGYAAARPTRRGRRAPWSRHDIAFLGSASGVIAIALAGRLGGAFAFDAYPLLHCPTSPATVLLNAGLVAVALFPFLDRRGIERR